MFSRSSFPWNWRTSWMVHITLKTLVQISEKLHTHGIHVNKEIYTSFFSCVE